MRCGQNGRMISSALFDPSTYVDGVPYDLIDELRADGPVQWIDEPAVLGWEEGRGYWAVLSHELVNRVLRDAEVFSSHIGATQIRDPGTAEMLAFVQRIWVMAKPGRDHSEGGGGERGRFGIGDRSGRA